MENGEPLARKQGALQAWDDAKELLYEARRAYDKAKRALDEAEQAFDEAEQAYYMVRDE